MKKHLNNLAIKGGQPLFNKVIPVGQINFPEWDRFEKAFKGIFERKYYTNHGPLLTELESKLEKFLNVKNAICMNNGTNALTILAKAMGLKGKVITPAFSFIATAQSLSWAGLTPAFCDIDLETHHINKNKLENLLSDDVSAILAVNLWGSCVDLKSLSEFASNNRIRLFFDSAQGFGCSKNNIKLANYPEASVFSFHATKILNSAEGGCVTTNDDDLADRIRNIRASYGLKKTLEVPFTGNGRMSEAQAAIALLSLEDYSKNQQRNQNFYNLYSNLLADIEGLKIYNLNDMNETNFQYVVVEIDEKKFGINRDRLVEILKAENILSRRYFTPGIHRSFPYNQELPEYLNILPNTDTLCARVFQLPSGQDVNEEIIKNICDLIKLIKSNSSNL